MAKQPLTTSGVANKQEELFALEQHHLDIETQSLINDFKLWISNHFELSTSEQGYLGSADESFIRLLSSIVFVGVRNRLPIDFSKTPITLGVKRFETTSSFDFVYEWGGTTNKTTHIKLDIVYI